MAMTVWKRNTNDNYKSLDRVLAITSFDNNGDNRLKRSSSFISAVTKLDFLLYLSTHMQLLRLALYLSDGHWRLLESVPTSMPFINWLHRTQSSAVGLFYSLSNNWTICLGKEYHSSEFEMTSRLFPAVYDRTMASLGYKSCSFVNRYFFKNNGYIRKILGSWVWLDWSGWVRILHFHMECWQLKSFVDYFGDVEGMVVTSMGWYCASLVWERSSSLDSRTTSYLGVRPNP